jgi:hypothetical protein
MKSKPVVISEHPRGWLFFLLVALAVLFTPVPPWAIDQFYSRAIYPTIQGWFTTATNLVPFTLLDFIIIATVFLTARSAVRLLSVARHVGVVDAIWEGSRRLVRAAAIATVLFMLIWGLHYRRVPLESELTGGSVAPMPSVPMLQAVAADANVLAARLRGASTKASLDFEAVSRELREPFAAAMTALGRSPLTTPGRPKYSLVLTPFFAMTGVDGMVDPLALESIVNPDLLPFERPYVLAHEWAHLAGMADEAEARATGWLACMNGSPALAYSASLFLILEAREALPADLQPELTARLDVGVRSDLEAIADRLHRENPAMQEAATRVYDQYLKVNRAVDSRASQGRTLALILTPRMLDAMGSYRKSARTD